MLTVLQFKTEYRTGRDPVDWVLLAPQGEDHQKTQTWQRVARLRPPEHWDEQKKQSQTFIDMKAKWSVIGPQYEAWRKGNEIPEGGTPLAAWSGVSPDQADALKAMGIRTVEAVRDMGDGAVNKMPFPNARKLPEMAKRFLDGEAVAAKDARIAEMEERLAAMAEALEQQKPKRGRPKKAEASEEAA